MRDLQIIIITCVVIVGNVQVKGKITSLKNAYV